MDKKLDRLITEIKKCKDNRTCRSLTCRGYYFEPNKYTISEWNAANLYSDGIDSRVLFVCESPGPSSKLKKNLTEVQRCWKETSRDKRFFDVRQDYGFESSYITNFVKCGPRRRNRHKLKEVMNCQRFLLKELDIIKPRIVVAVGGESHWHLCRYYSNELIKRNIHLYYITHYAIPRNPWDTWDEQFPMLKELVRALNKFY